MSNVMTTLIEEEIHAIEGRSTKEEVVHESMPSRVIIDH
jgi:hypothetical protein